MPIYERPPRRPAPVEKLLGDASPTWRERQGRPSVLDLRDAAQAGRVIEDRPDPKKAKAVAERHATATFELLRRYREARKTGSLGALDPRVVIFCERLRRQNRGKLPGAKNKALLPRRRRGRTEDRHFKLLIHLAVSEEIKRGAGHGATDAALKLVADRFAKSYPLVRGIFYDRSPERLHDVEMTLALRECIALADQPKTICRTPEQNPATKQDPVAETQGLKALDAWLARSAARHLAESIAARHVADSIARSPRRRTAEPHLKHTSSDSC
jgi:hypothetical protein